MLLASVASNYFQLFNFFFFQQKKKYIKIRNFSCFGLQNTFNGLNEYKKNHKNKDNNISFLNFIFFFILCVDSYRFDHHNEEGERERENKFWFVL